MFETYKLTTKPDELKYSTNLFATFAAKVHNGITIKIRNIEHNKKI